VVAERNGGRESASRAAAQQVTCSRRLSLPAAAEAAGLVTNAMSHLRTGTRTMVLGLEAAQSTPRIEVEDADPAGRSHAGRSAWMRPASALS
jgi:hypothetical protein